MIDNSKEYIICAAVWYDDGIEKDDTQKGITFPFHGKGRTYTNTNITTGFVIGQFRHGNCIAIRPTNPEFNGGMKTVQGFLTSKGKFVDRWQGAVIAHRCGQISDKAYYNTRYEGTPWTEEQLDMLLEEVPTEERHFHHKEYPMAMMFSEDLY